MFEERLQASLAVDEVGLSAEDDRITVQRDAHLAKRLTLRVFWESPEASGGGSPFGGGPDVIKVIGQEEV